MAGKIEVFTAHLIHPSQYGFQSGKSTLTNLATHTSYIRLNMAKGSQVDSIYTDFSKAFDKVDHGLLLFKLGRYGIRGPLLAWLGSYLSDRSQRVKFASKTSEPIIVRSGVPQGRVLSTLLFKLFNNDLPHLLDEVEVSLFADDLKMSKIIKSHADTIILQQAANTTRQWCLDNFMYLNESKCLVISFTRRNEIVDGNYSIGGTILLRVNSVKDLGVILDSKLNFKKQVDKIVSSGNSILGFIKRRAKEFDDPYLTKQLFSTLVLPVVEYVSSIWAPYRDIDIKRLESIQKQFLIFALRHLGFSGPQLPAYRSRLLLLNMIPLEDRRNVAYALLAFDLIRGNVIANELKNRIIINNNQHSTRSRRFLREELHHSDFSYNDVVSRAIRNFNSNSDLYDESVSKNTFKSRIINKLKCLRN